MSEIVTFEYYSQDYKGQEADSASFPSLVAHATRLIAVMTRNRVTADNIDKLPAVIANNYKNAICAQVDYFGLNGLESVNAGNESGFTVGKVTVQGKNSAKAGGAMSAYISPMAVMFLEQTGLLNPSVPCFDWWW